MAETPVTGRTKLDVALTLQELWAITQNTKPTHDDKWLVVRGAEAALYVAEGYARGFYDRTGFEGKLPKILAEDLTKVVKDYRTARREGRAPWEEE